MAGDATLDPTILVDGLVPTIDDLRSTLHAQFGVRPYRVFTVSRTWTGQVVGEGSSNDTEIEILPRPRVREWSQLEYKLQAMGRDLSGAVVVDEVSLTYSYPNLAGAGDECTEFFIRIDEGSGHSNPSRFYIHAKPPYVDREKSMGWVMWLRNIASSGCET